MTPSVVLVGASGFGRNHLTELLGLHADGGIRLVGVVDIAPAPELERLFADHDAHPVVGPDLARLLDAVHPDSVVIATPPHTHAALARIALSAGCAVYLEKPPVPLPSELAELNELAGDTRFEIGFQQTPGLVAAVTAALDGHDLGPISRVTGFGAVRRPDSYYHRADWAGRIWLDGRPVFDGSLFNPFAHVVHGALAVARTLDPEWRPAHVTAERGSVRGIEADDVAALRIESASGREAPVVTAIATTAADEVVEPSLLLVGERGTVRVRLRDLSGVAAGLPLPARRHESMLRAAVLDPRGAANPLLTAPAAAPFVGVVAAVAQRCPPPTPLSRLARVSQDAGERWVDVPGLTRAVEAAATEGTLLSDQRIPWLSDQRIPMLSDQKIPIGGPSTV